MTKEDFQLIATVLVDACPANATERSFLSALVVDFANKLQGTNSAFKRDLFIQAATGVVPVTARKVRKAREPKLGGLDARGYDSDGNRREYW